MAQLALPPGKELAHRQAAARQEVMQADLDAQIRDGGVRVTVNVSPDDGGSVHGPRHEVWLLAAK